MNDKAMKEMVLYLRIFQLGAVVGGFYLVYKTVTINESAWSVGMFGFFAICVLYGAYKLHGAIANSQYMIEIGLHLVPTKEEKIDLLKRKLDEPGLTPKQRAHLEYLLKHF